MIPSGFECVQYDVENKSDVDTEEDLYGVILFLQHFFFSGIKPDSGHCARKN